MSCSFGYVRVSSRDQNEARQLNALSGLGISDKNIFFDKQSGKDFNRPDWKSLMRKIRAGDVLFVKSIDRLGRNYDEILSEWRNITKVKRADIVVLDMPLLDTRRKGADLTGVFVADLVLQILSYVAQTERDSIRIRQAEGIAAAKARGKRFGRDKLSVPDSFYGLRVKFQNGEISSREAAQILSVSHSTFIRWCKGDGSKVM